MLPKNVTTTVHTTIGDLANAFYEEALAELGNEQLARAVSAQLLKSYMPNKR